MSNIYHFVGFSVYLFQYSVPTSGTLFPLHWSCSGKNSDNPPYLDCILKDFHNNSVILSRLIVSLSYLFTSDHQLCSTIIQNISVNKRVNTNYTFVLGKICFKETTYHHPLQTAVTTVQSVSQCNGSCILEVKMEINFIDQSQ